MWRKDDLTCAQGDKTCVPERDHHTSVWTPGEGEIWTDKIFMKVWFGLHCRPGVKLQLPFRWMAMLMIMFCPVKDSFIRQICIFRLVYTFLTKLIGWGRTWSNLLGSRRQNISILCNQNTNYAGFAAFLFARVEIRPPGLTPVLPAVLRINIKC